MPRTYFCRHKSLIGWLTESIEKRKFARKGEWNLFLKNVRRLRADSLGIGALRIGAVGLTLEGRRSARLPVVPSPVIPHPVFPPYKANERHNTHPQSDCEECLTGVERKPKSTHSTVCNKDEDKTEYPRPQCYTSRLRLYPVIEATKDKPVGHKESNRSHEEENAFHY